MVTWFRKHPDDATLQAFQEGVLPLPGRRSCEQHIAGCAQCQRLLDDYALLNRTLAQLASAPVPVDLSDQILARVLAEGAFRAMPLKMPGRLWGLAGGFAALALAALLIFWPLLGNVTTMTLQLGRFVTGTISSVEFSLMLVRTLLLVLEPLRTPAMLVSAASMVLFAWLARSRLSL